MTGRVAVSSGGGARPQWRRDGREIYFLGTNNRMMSVSISPTSSSAMVGAASVLFQSAFYTGLFAASPDGQRFLIASPAPSTDIVPLEIRLNALAPH
jgi:hypothetical protein